MTSTNNSTLQLNDGQLRDVQDALRQPLTGRRVLIPLASKAFVVGTLQPLCNEKKEEMIQLRTAKTGELQTMTRHDAIAHLQTERQALIRSKQSSSSSNLQKKPPPPMDPSSPTGSNVGFKKTTQSLVASKYRVLVVDDTLMNRKVFDRMLRRIGVAVVKTVDSGAMALDMLQQESFNLVISDIQMPVMNGWQLSDSIRSHKCIHPKPLVVGLTADTSLTVRDRCLASGMADVIHKPITVVGMRDYFEQVIEKLGINGASAASTPAFNSCT